MTLLTVELSVVALSHLLLQFRDEGGELLVSVGHVLSQRGQVRLFAVIMISEVAMAYLQRRQRPVQQRREARTPLGEEPFHFRIGPVLVPNAS